MVKFQVADVSAVNTLVKLWVDSFTQAYQDVHSPENIAAYCTNNFSAASANKILSNEQMICFFALQNDHPVGLSIIHHQSCPIQPLERAAELKQLYILASQYGTGLGKTMIKQSFDLMREAGKQWTWLCVSDLNFRAQHFYEKLGFEKVGIGPILAVGTERLNSSIMIRRL